MKNQIHSEGLAKDNLTANVVSVRALALLLVSATLAAGFGCGMTGKTKQDTGFFTSGNREADQRASQRMAKAEQLSGSGEGAGEKNAAQANEKPTAQAEKKLTLYERLGGEDRISIIVDDFLPRAMQDPRVNWERKGITHGGFFHRYNSVSWKPTPQKIAQLKKHFVQFFALATGGPSNYEGKGMKSVHENMHITNPQFDAAVGDLKASLDKFQVPNREQKELLAVVESTRPQVVTER